jgi:hypothetical protein
MGVLDWDTRVKSGLRASRLLSSNGRCRGILKLEGGTRDTRLDYLIALTHCIVVTDSSMDIYFGIFRFYVEADEEELILSTSLQSQYFVLGIPPWLAWRFVD